MTNTDWLANTLASRKLHIKGAWKDAGWTVRIESDMDADDHDTYYNARGETFTAALADAVKWSEFLVRKTAVAPAPTSPEDGIIWPDSRN